ncbi:hypothetical protein ACWGOQ_0023655 [Aquimarina sp. M1]
MPLFLTSCSSKSQQKNYIDGGYYRSVYEADSLFIEGNYLKSYSILEGAFKQNSPINLPIYYEYKTYIKSAYLTNNKGKSFDGLRNLISKYGITWNQINNDSILKLVKTESNLSKKHFDSLSIIFIKTLDISLREEILEMKIKDQLYRGRNYVGENITKQDSIDDVNTKKLITIFEKYGYPNSGIIGTSSNPNKNNPSIRVMLLHTDDSIRESYFMPKILSFVKKGKCNPFTYGAVYDQLLLYNKEEQKYWTYETKKNITNTKKVNEFRESIGLPQYGYETWRFNRLYKNIK